MSSPHYGFHYGIYITACQALFLQKRQKLGFFNKFSYFSHTKTVSNLVPTMPLKKYPPYTGKMPKARKKQQQAPDNRLFEIGKRLQSIRKRRGLTQKELGEKIGLTREAIAAYEAGRSHLMDTTLLNMAAVLRVSISEILGFERKSSETPIINRRWAKRVAIIESLPESVKKHILRTLDDIIKANTRLSIFQDRSTDYTEGTRMRK